MSTSVQLLVIVISCCCAKSYAQEDGDVRLVDGGSARRGRVELFFKGEWGTVEVDNEGNLRRWAADCICRQLGYQGSSESGDVNDLSISPASDSVRRWIEGLFCGEITMSSSGPRGSVTRALVDSNNLHILRCDYDFADDEVSPNRNEDFAIECNEADDEGYDTEVRLVQGNTGFTSSGFVEIRLDDSWEPVCNMKADDADSACRQLGWTNAASFGSLSTYVGDSGRVDEFFCTSSSRCLRDCFDYPSETDTAKCTEHSFINCTFSIEDEERFSSGTPDECSGLNTIIAIAVGVSVGVAAVISLPVGGILIYFCYKQGGCKDACGSKPRNKSHATNVSNEAQMKTADEFATPVDPDFGIHA